ncbi:MAG: hypothetical protein J6I73_07730 [Treponema sp.]|nr:hypothetical protein [Treponema sp.]
MAVSIFEKQNDKMLLKCLCKQRKVYTSVKHIQFWVVLIEVGLVTILTIITTIWQNEYASSCLTIVNMSILIASKYIERITDRNQETAAKIQQYFDATCYNTVSEQTLFTLNSIFVHSELAELIADIKESELPDLKNWYSDYSNLSPKKQILFSQNENINWDSKLRTFYKRSIIVFSVLMIAGIIIYGVISNIPFNNWITVVSFVLVILDCDINSILKLNDDIGRLIKLADIQKKIEKQIENNCFSFYEKIIELQNYIYEHRKNCFLIPDFIYKVRKKTYQSNEDKTALILKDL